MSEITYSTITLSGTDAFDFLQAQLATDLTSVAKSIDTAGNPDSTTHRSAWCSPKGRVICTPTVEAVEKGLELRLPADLGEMVLQRLTMFRFRSQVEFELSPGGSADAVSQLQLLQAGIPEIALAQTEKFTPHMLNLDLLQMVSVEKGCYPGQEIVARTHFRGASKRRCFRFACDDFAEPGGKVSNGERDVGEVVNELCGELLAVVPVNAADMPLFISGQPLTRLELPYAL